MTCVRTADLTRTGDDESRRFDEPAAHATQAVAHRCSRRPTAWQPVRIGRLAQFDVTAPGGRLVRRRRDLARHQHGAAGSGLGHTVTPAPSSPTPPEQHLATILSALTRSERRVAHLVAEGCSNREIADRLMVSPRTIETHMRAIYRKLAVATRVQVARVVLAAHDRPGRHAR